MKRLFIALPTILLMILIGSSELSSNSNLNIEKRESYEACIRLKNKAPYINLKCEHLLGTIPNIINVGNIKGIRTLSGYESNTRKVNKSDRQVDYASALAFTSSLGSN